MADLTVEDDIAIFICHFYISCSRNTVITAHFPIQNGSTLGHMFDDVGAWSLYQIIYIYLYEPVLTLVLASCSFACYSQTVPQNNSQQLLSVPPIFCLECDWSDIDWPKLYVFWEHRDSS